ncbi:L-amino acid N-acyltransferase YncA [Roseivivax marinus]|uniref:GNAT family N-acetyltransferase n=1 Tax=Roseivivax marinus TaxID=1379903 RepID=UPI0008ABB576|nr:GNAT family N-acetyltransferase [Roseivivax marinus]SEK55899.1 L-amino acid N-acyltransferase YncA [Roseivivax marinus]
MTDDSAPIPIRQARATDVDAIRACAEQAYAPYIPRIGRAPAPMAADFAALVARGVVWVATDAEHGLLGFVTFWPEGDHVYLDSVAVRPEAAGRGLGKALIRFCEERALADGFGTVALYTNAAMTENQRIYPRLGYVEVDRREDDGFDRVFYEKRLT